MDNEEKNGPKLGRPSKRRIERNRNTFGRFSSNKETNVDNNEIDSIEDNTEVCLDVPVRTKDLNSLVDSNDDSKKNQQLNIPTPSPPLTNKEQPESRAIGICNHSVVKKKNLRIYKFTCKKKKKLLLKNEDISNPNQDKIYKIVNGNLGLKSKTLKNKK